MRTIMKNLKTYSRSSCFWIRLVMSYTKLEVLMETQEISRKKCSEI